MNTTPIALTTLALGLGSAALAQGAPGSSSLNQWLRARAPEAKDYDVGGQFRLRFEDRRNLGIAGVPGAVDFSNNAPDSDNSYWLFRTKFHVGYKPCAWISAFVEGRDSFTYNDDRVPDFESDRIELHQAWVTIGNAQVFPLTGTLGRQELSYGDERLVGAFDWNNLGRVFDAVKLRYENDLGWLEGFAGRPVIPDDNNFNMSNEYELFSGLYGGSKTLVEGQELHAYFLARNASKDSPNLQAGALVPLATERDIYTAGGRLKSLPGTYGNWDYTVEAAYQFGRFTEPGAVVRLDHEAYAASLNIGYTFKRAGGAPRVALEYNYATGDGDPADDKHGTFENLYPTNHKFYGAMDLFSWQNLQNGRLNASVRPHKEVTVSFDANAFWLQDDRDYFYQANGMARTTGGYGRLSQAGKYVGTELDLVVTYSPDPSVSLQMGIGRFFVGNYPEDSLGAGGTRDAHWAYTQLKLDF